MKIIEKSDISRVESERFSILLFYNSKPTFNVIKIYINSKLIKLVNKNNLYKFLLRKVFQEFKKMKVVPAIMS